MTKLAKIKIRIAMTKNAFNKRSELFSNVGKTGCLEPAFKQKTTDKPFKTTYIGYF